jgi:hypothetical protein
MKKGRFYGQNIEPLGGLRPPLSYTESAHLSKRLGVNRRKIKVKIQKLKGSSL